jgi:hypothetical protein
MVRQRSVALGAQPYERTDTRQGHANGCAATIRIPH